MSMTAALSPTPPATNGQHVAPGVDDLRQFVACVYEPDDIVEVRCLRSGETPICTWHLASELPNQAERLSKLNAAGRNIYFGANPRSERGGKSKEDVALARCLFDDFDGGCTIEEALKRIEKAELPRPTQTLHSGHGVHCYWRLSKPMTDLAAWTELQKGLIAALDSDKSIHDAPRIMRAPGFLNMKAEPVPCAVFEADESRVYEVEHFRLPAPPEPPAELPAESKSDTLDVQPTEPKSETTAEEAYRVNVAAFGDEEEYAALHGEGHDDTALLIERATKYVAKAKGVAEGNRDNAAFSLAGHVTRFVVEVSGLKLSEPQILDLLRPWNQLNSPPLDERTLAEKVASALKGNGTPRQPIIIKRPRRRKAGARAGQSQPAPDGRPTILLNFDETKTNDAAIAALATCDQLYQRAGALVRVVRDAEPAKGIKRPKDSPVIARVKLETLRERMAKAAFFMQEGRDGEPRPTRPPDWCQKAVLARGQWKGIRRLEAVVESPVLRADGTVLQVPGYDAESCLLYEPQCEFPPVPDSPTLAEAQEACGKLLEVVEDFPFKAPEHRAAWLAATLTPLARHAFSGPAPLFAIDSNTRGAGKSKSSDASAEIVTGREFPRMACPENDAEMRKCITSIAKVAEPLVLIDNIRGALDFPSFDAALTSTIWSDRKLGSNEMERNLPLRTVWYATSNNLQLGGDTARRTCHIRLETKEENPEERTGFKHPELLDWVRGERPRLVVAALTILRAYFVAGRPAQKHLTAWGSFEGWSRLVRSALVWAGQPDPALTRTELREQTDRDATALAMLIAGWEELCPIGKAMTLGEVSDHLAKTQGYPTLRAALAELAPPGKHWADSLNVIGMKMRRLRRRVTGGKFLDSTAARAGAAWGVYEVADLHGEANVMHH